MILSLPPSLSDHFFLNTYTMKVYMILLSTYGLALSQKDSVRFAKMLMILQVFLSAKNSLISNTSLPLEEAHWINTSEEVKIVTWNT